MTKKTPWNKGIKLSEKDKAIISERTKIAMSNLSPEIKAKLGNKGVKRSEEFKQKLRDNAKNKMKLLLNEKYNVPKEKIYDLFIVQNKTTNECAKILNIPVHQFRRKYLERYKIKKSAKLIGKASSKTKQNKRQDTIDKTVEKLQEFSNKYGRKPTIQEFKEIYGANWSSSNFDSRFKDYIKTYDSYYELQIIDILNSLNISYRRHDRKLISPLEIDIVCDDYKIGIEIDDIRTHCREKDYHISKTNLMNNIGYRLIHITDDEILNKKELIANFLKVIFKKSETKIGASKCKIRIVDKKTEKEFLNSYHFQGFVNSMICYGLFYKDELVSIMTFGKTRKSISSLKYDYELLRYCCKEDYIIIGGAKRLLSRFEKDYKGSIISFSDVSKMSGNIYTLLGFEYSHRSEPSYMWFKEGEKLLSRYQTQKSKLVAKGFDSSKSENQIMTELGYSKFWNCGNDVWVKNI